MTDIESRKTIIPARRSRAANAPDIANDDSYYEDRHMGSSARRYQQPRPTQQRDTEGGPLVAQGPAIQRVDAYGRPVMRQGNREYVMVTKKPTRRFHWSVFLGLTMLLMIAGWVAFSALGTWWTDWRDYTAYGYPRTYQVDAVVGHHDSPAHPSHFLFMNLGGTVVIIEFPGGDTAKGIVYRGAMLFGSNPSYIPVTGSFADPNGNGKPNMIVSYEGQSQIWTNNGSKFIPPGS